MKIQATNLKELVEEMRAFYKAEGKPLPENSFMVVFPDGRKSNDPKDFEQLGPETAPFKQIKQLFEKSIQLYLRNKTKH